MDVNDPLVAVIESESDERTPPTTTTDMPTLESELSTSNGIEHVDKQTPVAALPADKVAKLALVIPVVAVGATHPTCLAFASVADVAADPVEEAISDIST
jgi:hypothetical protein